MLLRLSDFARLFHADCRDAIKSLPDNSIDSVVTDPPYGLQFMGAEWDKLWRDRTDVDKAWRDAHEGTLAARARKLPDYSTMSKGADMQANHLEWAKEVFRVLKPGGFIAAFSASRTYHHMACAIEDAGFEIRDSLMWLYGTGFPKSHDVSKGIDKAAGAEREVVGFRDPKSSVCGDAHPDHSGSHKYTGILRSNKATTDAARQWEGWGTALKPAFEPIVLARKPLSEGTVAANVLRWGTGALNIDGCRVGLPEGDALHDGVTHSGKSIDTGVADTKWGFKAVDRAPGLGRWPANVVHDGSDEVVGMFPETANGFRENPSATSEAGRVTLGKFTDGHIRGRRGHNDSGSAARFFYSAKASKADRAGSKHPTVKPIALMQWLARLITPPGGTVLDPFAGSGTTGAACEREGFNVILCERESEYVEDIKRRLGGDPLSRILRWNAAVASYRAKVAA